MEGSVIFRVPRRTVSHSWDSTGPGVTQASLRGLLSPGLSPRTRSITHTALPTLSGGAEESLPLRGLHSRAGEKLLCPPGTVRGVGSFSLHLARMLAASKSGQLGAWQWRARWRLGRAHNSQRGQHQHAWMRRQSGPRQAKPARNGVRRGLAQASL